MREILVATAIAGFIMVVQLGAHFLVTPTWIAVGLGAIVVGLAASIPAAILYHVRLYSALHTRGALDPGWIWHPTRFHARLTVLERKRVFGWFYVGVVGWVLALGGCFVIALVIWTQSS